MFLIYLEYAELRSAFHFSLVLKINELCRFISHYGGGARKWKKVYFYKKVTSLIFNKYI